jgi:hypothetical protein
MEVPMLSSAVHNRFSARAENLNAGVAQLVALRDTEIAPFEEEEQSLRRRLRVLELQLALLCEHPRPGPETSHDRYQAALNTLAQDFVARHRQRLDSRLSDFVPRPQTGGVPGELARRQRSIQQFEERVAGEMAIHRAFDPERPGQQRATLIHDLQQEKESIETTLHALGQSIATMSGALEQQAHGLTEQLSTLRRERDAVHADTQAHEQWLTACRQADLIGVVRGLRPLEDSARASFINRLGQGGRNGLHFACEALDLPIANLLLCAGARVDIATDRGRLPIHLACRHDRGEQTRTFLSWLRLNRANVNACDGDGRGALNEAAYYGNITAVRWLLEHGNQLTACDRHRRTALHVAAAAGHTEVVDLLLTLGADPWSVNGAGERPLIEAVLKGHAVVARLFFDRGLWLTAAERATLCNSAAGQVPEVRRALQAPLEQALAHGPGVGDATAASAQRQAGAVRPTVRQPWP